MPDEVTSGKSPERLKRVKRIKKYILTIALVIVVAPLTAAIVLGIYAHSLKVKLYEAQEQLDYYLELQSEVALETSGELIPEAAEPEIAAVINETGTDSSEPEVSKSTKPDLSVLTPEEIAALELSNEELYDGYRKVYLTFDDGPSSNTDDILDILAKYDVKATFFVIEKEGRKNEKLYQRIVDEGHTLGMHSRTHVYADVYGSTDDFINDTNELREFLYMVTGVQSNVYRFPGGSSNHVSKIDMKVFASILENDGIHYFDWNVSSGDSAYPRLSSSQIVKNVTGGLGKYEETVILFHDTQSKKSTVQALPEIIEYILAMDNTVILPITDDTNPIQHLSVQK